MPSINLRDVGVLSPHPLFQSLTMTIGDTDRIGLIAGNGGGKTTLLRCLAGLAEPTIGDVVRSRGMRVGYVEQDVPENLLNLPLAEAIRRALPPAERDSSEWRVAVVLDEFGAPAELHDRPVHALSGGWQRLALIARAWVTEPDALLLDEPTNHLDLAKIQMLERWIGACRVPMVIASHDRRFLDACTTRTLFLRPGTSRLYAHPYTRARHLLAEDDAAQEAKLAKDTREVDRLRRNANESEECRNQQRQRSAAEEIEATARTCRGAGADAGLGACGTVGRHPPRQSRHACEGDAGAGRCRCARAGRAVAVPHRQARHLPAGSDRGARPQRCGQVAVGAAVAPRAGGRRSAGAARQPDDRGGLCGSAHVASAGRRRRRMVSSATLSGRAISVPSVCWPVRDSAWICSDGRSRGFRSGRRRGSACWRCG